MKFIRFLAAAALTLASSLSMAQSGPDPLIVTDNSDANTIGTLRFAMNFANGSICSSTSPVITFASPMTIKPLTSLPPIQCDTTIDGGGARNTNPLDVGASNATFRIVIDGSACVDVRAGFCDGFTIEAPGAVLQDLKIQSFAGNGVLADGFAQFELNGDFVTGNTNGVFLNGSYMLSDASSDPGARTIISGNQGSGIYVDQDGAYLIMTGALIDANGADGITVVGDNNSGGAVLDLSSNFIRNNRGFGIYTELQEVLIGQNIISGNGGDALHYALNSTPFGPPPVPPQIDSWTFDGTTLVVNVSAPGASVNDTVDVFSNPGFSIDNLPGVHEGQEFVGTVTLTTATAGGASGQLVVARASDIAFPTGTVSVACSCESSEYSASVLPPLASLDFSPNPILSGGSSTLTIHVKNNNPAQTMSSVGFTYHLPSTISLGAGSITSGGSCGTLTPLADGVTVSNATIAAGAECAIQIPVKSSADGSQNSGGTGAITSSLGTGGTPATGRGTLIVTTPSVISLSPSVDFGNVAVGTSAFADVTFRSNGSATLSITSVSASTTSPPATSAFTLGNDNCSGRLFDPNVTCTVRVTFTPGVSGAHAGQLQLVSNATAGTLTVPLSGTGTAPVLQVTPNPAAFGSVFVGLTPTLDVTLTNTGNGTMQLFQLNVVNTSGTAFTKKSTTCGATLAVGASCTVTVQFAPGTATGFSGSLDITANLQGSTTASVALSGTGIPTPAAVQLSPTSLVFTTQNIGTTSPAQPVTLTNTGGTALSITSIVSSPEFPVSGCAAGTLAPGASCTMMVTFSPSATGARTGTVTITDSASGSPHTVALTGTGAPKLAPALSLSTSSLTFALQAVGTSSAPQSITVSNTGNAALDISTVTVSGASFAASGCAATSVAPGSSCSIAVTFTPDSTGAKTGSVTIASNDAGSPAVVSLSGTGGAPAVLLSPASLTFPRQTVFTASPAQDVVLTNTGDTPLHIAGIAISGDFGYSGCGFPLTLAPGASCTFSVTFSPLANGPATGTITVTTDAPGSPHTIALHGTGANGPQAGIALRPFAIGFGNVRVGAQATDRITVVSNGTAPLHITSISMLGTAFAQGNACPATLAVGQTCDIVVTFTPDAIGALSGQVLVESDGDPARATVQLSGNGVATAPAVLAVERFVDFGQHVVDTSTRLPLELRNTGESRLDIASISILGAAFSIEGSCGSIEPGGACTIVLVFRPGAVATLTGLVTIVSNDARGTVGVDLLGQGVAIPRAEIELSTDGIGFANQLITTRSAAQRVTISSVGTAPLTIRGITVSPPFELAGGCPATLAPGAHCDVLVTFLPLAMGPAHGRLTVDSDAEEGRDFASLTGTGCGFVSVAGMRSLQKFCGSP